MFATGFFPVIRLSHFSMFLLPLIGLAYGPTADAAMIAYWDFNDSNLTVDQGAGSLAHNVTLADVNYQAGTTENGLTPLTAGTALNFKSNANNGKNFTFSISTVGLTDLILTFSTMKSSNGFSNNQLSYSTDGGGSFTAFGSTYNPPTAYPAAGSLKTYDFSSIAALDNNPSVQIRITLNGATNNGGMKRVDNVQFNAVPEPATLAAMSIGLLALRRRRSAR